MDGWETPSRADRVLWAEDAEAAYQEAQWRIAKAKVEESITLDFGEDAWALPALSALPPEISELTALEVLNLSGTQVLDVSALSGLPALEVLNLSGTQVSDVSILSGLPDLRILILSSTSVSDVSVLSGLPALKSLFLSSTQVSDVSGLSGLLSLQGLYLSRTAVSDVSALSGLPSLRELDLSGTKVSDVSALSGLPSLQSLNLSGTAVSDLSPLSKLSALIDGAKGFFSYGLHYEDTPVAAQPVFSELVKLDTSERTIQTLQYLNGEHPVHGGPPPPVGGATTPSKDREAIQKLLSSDPLLVALSDFTFDTAEQLMRMAPFPEDMADLDPKLEKDRKETLSSLRDFTEALAERLERRAHNSPDLLDLIDDLRDYAKETKRRPVRPRMLGLQGNVLHNARLNEDIYGFISTALRQRLDQVAQTHLDLMRLYYRGALERLQKAEVLELTEEVTLQDLNSMIAKGAEALAAVADMDGAHAEPETIEVLRSLAHENEEMLKRLETLSEGERDREERNIAQRVKGGAMTVLRLALRLKAEAADFAELSNVDFKGIVDKLLSLVPPSP